MNHELPAIGVVIIGINVERYLADCIHSVQASHYPQELLTIVYVDGGSRDTSVAVAKDIEGVTVVELDDVHPTPGRGRNAGWKIADTPFIQFLDADTLVDPDWFSKALGHINGRTVAVCGRRRERDRERNLFHAITDMEWIYETGPCRYFGGDVLIKREVLEATAGFDEALVAGEDPELSYRVRQLGFQILRIDIPMTLHDINMSSWSQYFRRAYRSGYAYAEIGMRFIRNRERLWLRELARIVIRAVAPPAVIFAGYLTGFKTPGIILGLLVLLRPILRMGNLLKTFGQTRTMTFAYACHSILVIYPQFLGIARYFWGKFNDAPLQNQGVADRPLEDSPAEGSS
ncbi:MAG TPA: glycosyltransferase [Deltaproteobacteria bacterium]|nr:glycosyltransferase [Deltaproteobacteria bacterium]